MQDFALSPSTWTVQAPQLLVSQPMWVPVRPKSSRSKWTSRRRGSTSASCASPLTVTVMCCVVIVRPPTRTRGRARRRGGAPGRSSPRPSRACSRRGRGRRRPGGSAPRRRRRPRGTASSDGALPTQDGFGVGRGERASRRPPVRPIPTRLIVPVVVEPDDRGDADGGEVAGPPLELLVGAAAARGRRGMRISVRTSVGSIAVVKVSRKKSRAAIVALAGLAAADDRRVRREQHRRPVGGRVGVGDRAADRAPVADLRVADAAGDVVQERVAVADDVGSRGSGGASPGAPIRRSSSVSTMPSRPPTSRRSTRRPGWASRSLSSGMQAVAAGEELRLALSLLQDLQRLVQAPRTDVVELAGIIALPSSRHGRGRIRPIRPRTGTERLATITGRGRVASPSTTTGPGIWGSCCDVKYPSGLVQASTLIVRLSMDTTGPRSRIRVGEPGCERCATHGQGRREHPQRGHLRDRLAWGPGSPTPRIPASGAGVRAWMSPSRVAPTGREKMRLARPPTTSRPVASGAVIGDSCLAVQRPAVERGRRTARPRRFRSTGRDSAHRSGTRRDPSERLSST